MTKKEEFPYKSLLVVCSVNVARSRILEGYLIDFFKKKGLDITVSSGGIASHARDAMLISQDAKFVMEEEDIILSNDALSRDLKKKKHRHLIRDADLIITLTEAHKDSILKLQETNGKDIFTLKELAGGQGDIEDPSMKGIEGFRVARDEIKKYLFRALKKYQLT